MLHPDQALKTNYFTIKIPYALSLIATRTLTGTVEGEKEIIAGYKPRMVNGVKAWEALRAIRANTATATQRKVYDRYKSDIGLALLLRRYTTNISKATPPIFTKALNDAIPTVWIAFWTFRFMIGLWGLMALMIIIGFIYSWKGTLLKHKNYLRLMIYMIPVPFLASECGWVLAETGRQPWVIHMLMPTFFGTSSLTTSMVITSLVLFIFFYAVLISVEMFLMFKFARKGPSSLYTGRYHFESQSKGERA